MQLSPDEVRAARANHREQLGKWWGRNIRPVTDYMAIMVTTGLWSDQQAADYYLAQTGMNCRVGAASSDSRATH